MRTQEAVETLSQDRLIPLINREPNPSRVSVRLRALERDYPTVESKIREALEIETDEKLTMVDGAAANIGGVSLYTIGNISSYKDGTTEIALIAQRRVIRYLELIDLDPGVIMPRIEGLKKNPHNQVLNEGEVLDLLLTTWNQFEKNRLLHPPAISRRGPAQFSVSDHTLAGETGDIVSDLDRLEKDFDIPEDKNGDKDIEKEVLIDLQEDEEDKTPAEDGTVEDDAVDSFHRAAGWVIGDKERAAAISYYSLPLDARQNLAPPQIAQSQYFIGNLTSFGVEKLVNSYSPDDKPFLLPQHLVEQARSTVFEPIKNHVAFLGLAARKQLAYCRNIEYEWVIGVMEALASAAKDDSILFVSFPMLLLNSEVDYSVGTVLLEHLELDKENLEQEIYNLAHPKESRWKKKGVLKNTPDDNKPAALRESLLVAHYLKFGYLPRPYISILGETLLQE